MQEKAWVRSGKVEMKADQYWVNGYSEREQKVIIST